MNTLATDLLSIARKAKGVDSAADRMLSTVKAAGIKTLDQLNAAIRAAYAENKWSQTQGRPITGSKLKPAPEVVKQLVTAFRTALRLGMHLQDYETVYQIREAIRSRHSAHASGAEPRPDLVGVVLRSPNSLIGALWHDSMTLAEKLPEDRQHEFEDAVRKVMEQFLQYAPAELVQAAA